MHSSFFTVILSFALLLTATIANAGFPRGIILSTKDTTPEELEARTTPVLPEGYAWSNMHFNGTIGGVYAELEGDNVDEIYSKFHVLHPEIDIESALDLAARASPIEIMKRNKDGTHCCPLAGHDWAYIDRSDLYRQVRQLQGMNGGCYVNPRSCTRLTCYDRAAIFLCNDNYYGIAPSCNYLASYALDLMNDCSFQDNNPDLINPPIYTCGQEFDTDNYNVVITSQHCWIDYRKGPDFHGWWKAGQDGADGADGGAFSGGEGGNKTE